MCLPDQKMQLIILYSILVTKIQGLEENTTECSCIWDAYSYPE